MSESPPSLTQVLNGAAADPARRDAAFAQVYDDLLRIARAELARHRRQATLNTRSLVNEAYLKLFASNGADFSNRKHFFAAAARAMRQVVVDYARSRGADKRGAGIGTLSLDELGGAALQVEAEADQLVAIDAALTKLATLDPRLAEVLELRFFAGLEVTEIADLLGVSEPTIKRDTRTAKAFVQRELMLAESS